MKYWFIILVFFPLFGFGQIDTFNVYFKQDFEDDALGSYSYSDYDADWPNHYIDVRNEDCDIIQDEDGNNGTKVMRWNYPEGSCYGDGGGQWYMPLGDTFNEIYFSYRIYANPDFQNNLGGKLPGFLGDPDFACCYMPDYDEGFRDKCSFDASQLIGYAYYHNTGKEEYGKVFEFDPWVNFGIFKGYWHEITIRNVMNTYTGGVANSDGIMEVFVDSICVFTIDTLIFTENESANLGTSSLEIASAFGGECPAAGALADEWMLSDDYIVFKYADGITKYPIGNNSNNVGDTIKIPLMSTSLYNAPEESPSTDATRYEYYIASPDYEYAFYDVPYNENQGQSFTIGTTGDDVPFTIGFITFNGYKSGSPGTIRANLYTVDGSGFPTGSVLSTGTFNADLSNTSAQYDTIIMSSYDVSIATKYAIEWVCPSCDGSNNYTIEATTANGYAGGNSMYISGSSWTNHTTGLDFNFEVYGYYYSSTSGLYSPDGSGKTGIFFPPDGSNKTATFLKP